jgi:hypothetical protein
VTSEQLRSNNAQTPGKPGIIRDQKTKPDITIDDPVRSAKPPSPVQIRAAPPFSCAIPLVDALVARADAFQWTTVAAAARVPKKQGLRDVGAGGPAEPHRRSTGRRRQGRGHTVGAS